MATANSAPPMSPFGQIALKLNESFEELDRLSGQMERLSIESDSGLEKGKQILVKFSECSMSIVGDIQTLAKTLEESRIRAEKAAQYVASRANAIQARHDETERLTGRFQSLADKVRELSGTIASLKKPAGEKITAEDQKRMGAKLPGLDGDLADLTDEAARLQIEAREANMKTLERDAESLGQSLASARRKLAAHAPQIG